MNINGKFRQDSGVTHKSENGLTLIERKQNEELNLIFKIVVRFAICSKFHISSINEI